ncbi:transmembrane protein [Achlya hypogyna]|uniref:Transmembrane protein n=1 Tax=Achlya hypogyna TaxID=1202772 RepID=A0A1V9Z1S8_ACHHY|nr:transmembrane protein [Achlya hypogyna]
MEQTAIDIRHRHAHEVADEEDTNLMHQEVYVADSAKVSSVGDGNESPTRAEKKALLVASPGSTADTDATADVFDDDDRSTTSSDEESGSVKELGIGQGGAAPDLYSSRNIGLLLNYACVGLVLGIFPSTIYPFMSLYLNMDGYQSTAATVLVGLPWSFKMVIGILSDSFPICGYRRRPYILFGWSMCITFLVVMAVLPVGDPYYVPGEIQRTSNASARAVLNPNARNEGAKYILIMMFASFGYVIADVACDAVVVEFAQREADAVRGTTQTTVYMVRYATTTVGSAIVGFCFNGRAYGGSFDWSLSFNAMMALAAAGAALGLPATYFFPHETRVAAEPFGARCRAMWRLAQKRAIWQIMAFSFLNALLFDFEATPSNIVQRDWARVQPLNSAAFLVLANALLTVSLYVTKTYLLDVSWRVLILATTVTVVALDASVSFLTIFNVVRNQWFYLGAPVLGNIPQGIRFVVSGYVTVEVAEVGFEGTTYGLLTTVSNLALPFASSLSKLVDSCFDAYQDDIAKDTPYVRWQVAYTFIIMYAVRLLSNATLMLLPRQKKEAQALRRHGGSSRVAAVVAFATAFAALAWSVTTNLLSIFESTACLRIAGGKGCP